MNMEKIMQFLPLVLEVLGALVIVATVIVRITPSKGDDDSVDKIAGLFFKFLSYLPTLGINPRTKKLEEALKEIKEQKND